MPNYQITRVITPADSLALFTLDQAKVALGIDPADTSQDATIMEQIDAVSRAIDNHCDRTFVRQGYRDQFRYVYNWLRPGEPLRTRQAPLGTDAGGLPLVVITEDGTMLDTAYWETDIESGEIFRLDGGGQASCWGAATIVVDYDGGYDPVPPDVQGAALEWFTSRWKSKPRDPTIRGETVPDVISRTYADTSSSSATGASMPALVRDWLISYIKYYA